MTGWTLDPVGGYWLIAAIMLALAPLAAWGSARLKQSRGRRATLAALRLATLLLLLGFLLRPALETRVTKKLPGTLIVLPDASRSMQVADAAGDAARYTAMKDTLDAASNQIATLDEAWDVNGYAFGESVEPLKLAGGRFDLPEEPTGRQTAIGAALDDVLSREAQQRIVAVILLSDGAQRAFAPRDVPPQTAVRRLAADGIPLYTVAYGKPSFGEQADLRMSDLLANDVVFADTPATFEGVVTAAGYANQKFKVQLLWENADGEMAPVDATVVSVVPGKTRYPVRLTYTPKQAGEYKVTLAVEGPAGELVTTNNSQSTFVTVMKGGIKLLYLAGAGRIGGQPGIEPRFLRPALAGYADLHVDYQPISYAQPNADYRDRLRDQAYDVILLGDVDVTAFNSRTWREMAAQVGRGAGLAMLGGFHSFGPGGFRDSALADILPIEMGRAERQLFDEPPRQDMHIPGPLKMLPVEIGGQSHPIMRIKPGAANEALWRELPPLDGANRFDPAQIKPAASVIAQGDDPARSPLLVLTAWGDGRTAALAVDSTWHWQMEGFGEVHRRFWRQLVLWLAKKDESAGDPLWVRLDQRRFQQGSRVDFTLGANNAEGEPLPAAEYDVQITKPDGTVETIRTARRGDGAAGSFSETALPGDYRILVSARASGESIGTAAARFSVSDQDVELDQPAAEPMLLAALANQTAEAGGAGLAPEELPALLERLKAKSQEFEEQVVETITLWDSWPAMLAFVGLLSTEWFLRKRWGLV
jgi:uncharacterized membrane protein